MASSLITSQIDTAPKQQPREQGHRAGLITSQIDTAPKLGTQCGIKIVV